MEEACQGDAELRQRVTAPLAAHQGTDRLLDNPGVVLIGEDEPAEPIEEPGTVIGRYKLLEKIGEGGMVVVYMAEQTEPIHRKVALKIIKLGMDTKQVIARFEAERQALAMMDHPCIAKVLDAGATETGRPYFVMELVQGLSITEYCDKHNLSTKDRLALFVQVCQAVQHAHQKGIIHRDIKPSNVMVTHHDGKPVPKVIDFGIAKATNQKLTEKTLFTRYAHIIGTPAYMSPEQAELSDLDIDTRSDTLPGLRLNKPPSFWTSAQPQGMGSPFGFHEPRDIWVGYLHQPDVCASPVRALLDAPGGHIEHAYKDDGARCRTSAGGHEVTAQCQFIKERQIQYHRWPS